MILALRKNIGIKGPPQALFNVMFFSLQMTVFMIIFIAVGVD